MRHLSALPVRLFRCQMKKRREHKTQTRNFSLRLIWLLHLPLCSQCHGMHHLWTDHQRPTAMRLILKPLLHLCLVSKPKPYRGHNWVALGLQAETLQLQVQVMTLHKKNMTSGTRHSIGQQSQAKLTCNCLPGKQQMYLTADYNRTLAEHTWTQVTHYELVCVLFDGNQAASSSSACMAHHLCNCASDLTAQRSAVLLHSIEQCCHLLHWHVMSQEIPPIQALVSYRF